MRRITSPNIISLYASMAVAIFSTAIFLLIHFIFHLAIPIEYYAIFAIIIFVLTIIFFRFVLIRFIYDKIKIIVTFLASLELVKAEKIGLEVSEEHNMFYLYRLDQINEDNNE